MSSLEKNVYYIINKIYEVGDYIDTNKTGVRFTK